MSAPLAVNTADGTVWRRRAATRGGEALYAPVGVCSCPEFVMATLAELAEHGIAGSADVLPVPAGSVQAEVERLEARIAELKEGMAALEAQREVLQASRRREVADGEHYAAVHHSYRIPHDLPPIGGAR